MKLKKQQNRGRKHAKILAAMLVFLLCGCNHRDTEYKLSDSTDGSTEETVFGNGCGSDDYGCQPDEEQTVSEKSAGETTGIPEKREAQEAAPEETVQVYICGAVASPGVYTLPGGSRVVQAVEAAGGFLPDAEEKILNLARKIEDGEQITVWTREEAENMEITETPQQNTGGTEQASGSGKVNLNTAGKEELMTLSGIGESRADAIIAYREANGPFGSIEEIMNIEGIKGKMFEKIRGSIEV